MRLIAAAALAVLAGCSALPSTGACHSNAQCGPYKECDTRRGQCVCTDSRGCGDGEFCNASQQCQVVAGCQDNADCEQQRLAVPLICDVKRGQCVTSDLCVDDSQCALGKVCAADTSSCVAGCRDEADCPLDQGCLREEPAAPLGTCSRGACSVSAQCPAGSNCDLLTASCVADTRGPFCGACYGFDPTAAVPQCGDRANYCLVDTGDPFGQSHYCGVDCWEGQACPNGYACKDVIIVGGTLTPRCDVEDCVAGYCTRSGGPCQRDLDCPQGPPRGDCARAKVGVCAGNNLQDCESDAECGGSQGSCRFSECRLRESAAYGFCSCVVDSDCRPDVCRGGSVDEQVLGRCLLSGHKCYSDAECPISCVNGGCRIGANCKPDADRRCIDLQAR